MGPGVGSITGLGTGTHVRKWGGDPSGAEAHTSSYTVTQWWWPLMATTPGGRVRDRGPVVGFLLRR